MSHTCCRACQRHLLPSSVGKETKRTPFKTFSHTAPNSSGRRCLSVLLHCELQVSAVWTALSCPVTHRPSCSRQCLISKYIIILPAVYKWFPLFLLLITCALCWVNGESSSSLPVSCCGIEVTCTRWLAQHHRCTSSCLERVDCCLCHSSILVAAHFTVRGGGVCLPTRQKHFSNELFEAGQFRLESQGWQTRLAARRSAFSDCYKSEFKKSSPQIAVMEFCYSIIL